MTKLLVAKRRQRMLVLYGCAGCWLLASAVAAQVPQSAFRKHPQVGMPSRVAGGQQIGVQPSGSQQFAPPSAAGRFIQPPDARPLRPQSPAATAASSAKSSEQATSPEGRRLLLAAYEATKSAKTLEDYNSVITLCQQAVSQRLSDGADRYASRLAAWAHNRRGEQLVAAGHDQYALVDFDHACQLDPTLWQAYHNRGVSLFQAGKPAEAMADFTRTIELQPRYGPAWFNRGEIFFEVRDFQRAVADYSAALRIDPRDTDAYASRAHAYLQLGEQRRALADFDILVRLHPDSAEAHVDRGDALARVGQFQRAAQDYERAVQLDPKLPRAYHRAAWMMATCADPKLRDPQLAIDVAQKGIQLAGGTDHQSLSVLAAAFAGMGEFDRATQAQMLAMKTAPQDELAGYQNRLLLYQQRKPYYETIRGNASRQAQATQAGHR